MHQINAHARRSAARRAFTLVELLIVLGIIGVLVGIVVAVGQGVAGGAKRNATENTLQLLDSAYQAYIEVKDQQFPKVVTVDDLPANANIRALVFDGVDQASSSPINAIGYFIREANTVPKCKDILAKIPPQFLKTIDLDGAGPQPALPTIYDAWDNPIRFVLPISDGIITGAAGSTGAAPTAFRPATDIFPLAAGLTHAFANVRRNNLTDRDVTTCKVSTPADSDGGRCVANRAYFYSVGPDGLAGYSTPASCDDVDGTLDNVYTTKPTLPAKP